MRETTNDSGRRPSGRGLLAVVAALAVATACQGEAAMDRPEAAPGDVASPDAVVEALYEAISFEPGGRSDWDRLASLFDPEGRLIPPRGEESGDLPVLDVGGFIRRSDEYVDRSGLRERGFREREIGRWTERFGNIAHLFSAYESFHTPDDAEPFSRGVNSIQLVRDGGRWWVVTILWDVERPDVPIPEGLEP